MVSFNTIPSGTRVPFLYLEFDSSRAQQGVGTQPYNLLVLGQKLAAGTWPELSPVTVTSALDARQKFGAGSMLAGMAEALFANGKSIPATFVAIDDAAGATKATGLLSCSGTATAAGSAAVYVAGRRYEVAIAVGDTGTVVGDAVEAAINADPDCPATASNAAGAVTITARNGGVQGNDITLLVSLLDGEAVPAGVTITPTQMASGATNPDVTEVWPVLGSTHYNVVVAPWLDTANLNALQLQLEAWNHPSIAREALAFLARHDTQSNHVTFGGGRNSEFQTIMAFPDLMPNPTWELASALASRCAAAARESPSRPFKTLELTGMLAPSAGSEWTFAEAEGLLQNGLATFEVDSGGKVRVQRLVTTYQTNAAGAPDTAYLQANTFFQLSFLRWSVRQRFATRYSRVMLADDGTRIGRGSAVMTPSIAKGEMLSLFREWEELGIVEGFAQFKADLIVERNGQDPNRLDILLSPDTVNQWLIGAWRVAFLL